MNYTVDNKNIRCCSLRYLFTHYCQITIKVNTHLSARFLAKLKADVFPRRISMNMTNEALKFKMLTICLPFLSITSICLCKIVPNERSISILRLSLQMDNNGRREIDNKRKSKDERKTNFIILDGTKMNIMRNKIDS